MTELRNAERHVVRVEEVGDRRVDVRTVLCAECGLDRALLLRRGRVAVAAATLAAAPARRIAERERARASGRRVGVRHRDFNRSLAYSLHGGKRTVFYVFYSEFRIYQHCHRYALCRRNIITKYYYNYKYIWCVITALGLNK